MARIAGVNIPNHQHIVIGLTAIYGIGRPRAQDICAIAGVAPTKKVKDLDVQIKDGYLVLNLDEIRTNYIVIQVK